MILPTKGNTNSGEAHEPRKGGTYVHGRITNLLKPLFPLPFIVGLALAPTSPGRRPKRLPKLTAGNHFWNCR